MKQKWAIFILIAAGIAAYANTAKNGLFWDDDEFITRNAYIRSFRYIPQWFSQPLTAGAGVNSNYYRPLLQLSFAIDYKLWGLWPVGYHLENMFWHIAAGILLFFFLSSFISVVSSAVERPSVSDINNPIASLDSSARRKLLARNDGGTGNIIAFAASLLWLVHPVHVEAVAYANSRGDSMATVFILLSLILWLKKRFWASAAAFLAGLLSKEFAIVTPGLILLIESLRGASATWQSRLIPKIKPFLIVLTIASIYILLRLTVLNFQNTLNFYGIDMTKVDQTQPLTRYATSLLTRLMTFLKVLPIYGSILVWPNDLHMERTVEVATTVVDQTVITVLGGLILIGGLFLFVAFKGQALRRKAWPYQIPAFAFGWFFISILPVAGIIPISQILAEHFLYLPSIGFFLVLAWMLVLGLNQISRLITIERLNDSNHLILKHLIYWLILLGISIPLTVKTIHQNRVWRDPVTFYEYTLAHAQPTARVHNNLAMAYAETHEHQKAINNYQLAISLGDVYPNPHYNLGNTFMELGKLDEAEKEYRRALEIDPSFHYATLKLGQMYIDQGKIDEAKNLVCPVFSTQPLCQ